MRNLRKHILGLCLVGMGLVGAPAQAATGVGPYYATPSWDQTFPATTRFIVLTNMNSEAVLDRETGLVWEKVPEAVSDRSWLVASLHCLVLNLGGRKGWRLPTFQELASLIDVTQFDPALPSGHPFTVQTSPYYWSATTSADSGTQAWGVFFGGGFTHIGGKSVSFGMAWCVRGGQGADAQ